MSASNNSLIPIIINFSPSIAGQSTESNHRTHSRLNAYNGQKPVIHTSTVLCDNHLDSVEKMEIARI